ncbi:hypothetical protein FB451DRAFT_1401983 [Mycena latifolia]|nr:hypothetical protein FB451DRAFT_1401983 [Mycena latifolia]
MPFNSWSDLSQFIFPPGVIPKSHTTSSNPAFYSCKIPSPSPPACFTQDEELAPRLLSRLNKFIAQNRLGGFSSDTVNAFSRAFRTMSRTSLTNEEGTRELVGKINGLVDQLWTDVHPAFYLGGFHSNSQKGGLCLALEVETDNENEDEAAANFVPPSKRTIVAGVADWTADRSIIAHKEYLESSFQILPGGPCEDGAAIVKQAGLRLQRYQSLVTAGKGPARQIFSKMQVRYGILFSPGQFYLFERATMMDTDGALRLALLLSPFYDTTLRSPAERMTNKAVGALVALWFAMTIPGNDITHSDGAVTEGVPLDTDIDICTLAERSVVERMRADVASETAVEDVHLEDFRAERAMDSNDRRTPSDDSEGGESGGLNHLRLWYDNPGLSSPAHHIFRTSLGVLRARCPRARAITPDLDLDCLVPCPEAVLVTGDLVLAGVIWDANAATVYRATLAPGSVPVVLKAYSAEDLAGLVAELQAYDALASAAVAAPIPVPKLLGVFDDARGEWTGLVLEDVGNAQCPAWDELSLPERCVPFLLRVVSYLAN